MKKLLLALLAGVLVTGMISAAEEYGYDGDLADAMAREEYHRKGGSSGITGGMKNTPKPWQKAKVY